LAGDRLLAEKGFVVMTSIPSLIVAISLRQLFLLTVPAQPSAIAEWTQPWLLTLSAKDIGGNGAAKRAFGAPSMTDGQITDLGLAGQFLPDTDAVAKAAASVTTSSFSDSSASTGLIFSSAR
jgi:hypothetical protein